MTNDYTINDAFHDGFECGLLYALRYSEEILKHRMNPEDLSRMASHLELKKPWRSEEEWQTLP